MATRSAGLLLHRTTADGTLEVLLVHPGGPFWARKDAGAWSMPKGEYADDEDPLVAARREFAEELGTPAPDGAARGPRRGAPEGRQARRRPGRSRVTSTRPPSVSNTFTIEWPRGSGRLREFPEVDRAEWFDLEEAAVRILEGQRPLLDALAAL